jgi:hypothetical protein
MSFRAMAVLLTAVTGLFACGGGGGGAEPKTGSAPAQAAHPGAAKTRLTTLVGSRDSPGLHWIIAGDGFTAAQQPELRQAALALAQEMLDSAELGAHMSVWNVHVLEADSAQSGVDDAATSRFADTAFDGKLGCGSNSRVACVDWDKIHGALLDQLAPPAQLTVILNTSEYVGSSNASGIIVSRNVHAPRIAVHEMGHRVAGLADEYADAVVAGEWLPLYFEGRFPNVTTVTDANQAPWRHWLSEAADVGLFEGAFYVATGFYRPKADSIMRTLSAPIGEVNAEAWLRAQYRALPPLSAVTPAAAQVRGLAGETVEFSVVSPWSREVVSLQWFVDGAEISAARDASSFRFAADGGMHEVEVRARDVSGRIRAPDAGEAQGIHNWRVSPSAPAAVQKASRETGATSWLRVRVDAAGHTVLGWQPGPAFQSARIAPPGEADWQYTLLDASGASLASGDIVDPRVTRTALSAPGQPHAGHVTAVLESGDYLVGIPPGTSPRKLRIAATAAGQEKLGWAGVGSSGPIEISLDPP